MKSTPARAWWELTGKSGMRWGHLSSRTWWGRGPQCSTSTPWTPARGSCVISSSSTETRAAWWGTCCKQAGKLANRQASKKASKKAGKQAGKQAGRQAIKQAGKQAGKKASRQASKQAGEQASNEAGKHLGGIQSEPCPVGACRIGDAGHGSNFGLLISFKVPLKSQKLLSFRLFFKLSVIFHLKPFWVIWIWDTFFGVGHIWVLFGSGKYRTKLDLAFNNVNPKDWYFVLD